MAVAIPVIAAFASGAAAVTAIGAATTALGAMAAYATLAGSILTGVGALSGKRDLIKVGGILSLAGGIGTIASNAGQAAGAAASGATGAGSAVDEIVAETASAGAQGAGGAAAGAAGSEVANQAGSTVAQLGGGTGAPSFAEMAANQAGQGAQQAVPQASLMSQAGGAASSVPMTPPPGVSSALAEKAQGLTMGDMQSFWDRVQGVGKSVGGFIEKNPTLVKVGGEMLNGMYGAEAEQAKMLRDQQNYQKTLMERAHQNLNNPIRMRYNRQGGAA